MTDDPAHIFRLIQPIYARFSHNAVVTRDEPEAYFLGTHEVRAKDGYRTAFGGVEIRKNYVSAHLMPVYVYPELLDGISDALRKRMQGKSCFNFKTHDDALIDELSSLVEIGYRRFAADGKFLTPA